MIILNYDKLHEITETLFNHLQKIIDIRAHTKTLNVSTRRLEPWWNVTLTNKHRLLRNK